MNKIHRPAKTTRLAAARRQAVTSVRQPRPAPRRQGTRSGIIAAAMKEA